MSQLLDKIKNMAIIRHSCKIWSKDWFLKAISLWLAVVLWFFVGGEDSIEKTVRVPVEIINLPRDLVISNQFKKEIEVSVTGPRSIILSMDEQEIARRVDLSSATPGTIVIENDTAHITVPRSVSVQRVQPASVILSIDKLVQKHFPVVPNTVGSVASGFEVKMIRMTPDFITITGPATILDKLTELQSRFISIDGLERSVQLQIPLELAPGIVDLIGETSVTADVEIGPVSVTKTVSNVPVQAVLDGVSISVVPKTIAVTAKFPKVLIRAGKKPKDMITAHIVADEKNGKLRVVITPRDTDDLPVEIISITPPYVEEVGQPADASIIRNVTEKDKVNGDVKPPQKDETLEAQQALKPAGKKTK